MKKILGFDIGTKTIGIARSDSLQLIAQGIETFFYKSNDINCAVNKIISMITNDIEKVVIGMPRHMNGDMSDMGRYIEQIVVKIKEKVNIEIIYVDERMTSLQAQKMLIKADVSREKRKKVIDKVAAIIILQAYLDGK